MKENHKVISCSKKIIKFIILIDILSVELSLKFIIKNKYLIN